MPDAAATPPPPGGANLEPNNPTSPEVGPVAPARPAPEAAPSSSGLQEIVVTAQKREQGLQDVPVAITAITQDMLQANRVVSVTDLSGLAPNVTVRPVGGCQPDPILHVAWHYQLWRRAGLGQRVLDLY